MNTTASPFVPFKNKRAFEEIADQIRGLIYAGTFKPGDKLPPERELASQFRAGRMVVREALRTLEQSGLVSVKQGSSGGAYIKQADPEVITRSISDMIKVGGVSLKELTEARLGIESVVLEFAFDRITDEDLNSLHQNIVLTEELVRQGARALEENLNFHLLLAGFSRNTLFMMITESIMNSTRAFLESITPDTKYLKKILSHHKEIYGALKDKDLPAAREAMKRHLLMANQGTSEYIRKKI
ncbi:MAG: FadR family transcriptional regulator [Desulfobacteraceae bacterium]|nr:MAG: FadR family transcriptional regulator [Desulfobacteraceae bacterium]